MEDRSIPTAELLLDVRTPAEIALSQDGSRAAFSLHATVADIGSFAPSDLYLVEGDGPPAAAHRWSVERSITVLVAGRDATGVPLGSDDARTPAPIHVDAR